MVYYGCVLSWKTKKLVHPSNMLVWKGSGRETFGEINEKSPKAGSLVTFAPLRMLLYATKSRFLRLYLAFVFRISRA